MITIKIESGRAGAETRRVVPMERSLLPRYRQNENARNGGKPLRADARFAGRRERKVDHVREVCEGGRMPPPRV